MESTTSMRFILLTTIAIILLSIDCIEGRSIRKRSADHRLSSARRRANEEAKRLIMIQAIMDEVNGGDYKLEEKVKPGSRSYFPAGFFDQRGERKIRQHNNFSLDEYRKSGSMKGLTVEVHTEAPIQVPNRPLNKMSRDEVLRLCLDIQRRSKLYNIVVMCSYGKY